MLPTLEPALSLFLLPSPTTQLPYIQIRMMEKKGLWESLLKKSSKGNNRLLLPEKNNL